MGGSVKLDNGSKLVICLWIKRVWAKAGHLFVGRVRLTGKTVSKISDHF